MAPRDPPIDPLAAIMDRANPQKPPGPVPEAGLSMMDDPNSVLGSIMRGFWAFDPMNPPRMLSQDSPGQLPPQMAHDVSSLAGAAMTGGMPMAVRGAAGVFGGRLPGARVGNMEPPSAANAARPTSQIRGVEDRPGQLDDIFSAIRNTMATDRGPQAPPSGANQNVNVANYRQTAPVPPEQMARQRFMAEQGLSDNMMQSAPHAFREKIDADFQRWLAAQNARDSFRIVD